MAVKIASAMITLVLLAAVAVIVFAAMLVIMNGFSESDATWGIAAYGLLAVAIIVLAVISAAWLAARFAKRDMHKGLVVFLSSLISSLMGGLLVAVSGFLGVVAADIVRRNF